jgi:hypothetical protein
MYRATQATSTGTCDGGRWKADAAAIAKVAFTSEDRVRDVIRNFNADGFGRLRWVSASAAAAKSFAGLRRSPLMIEDGIDKLVCPLSLNDLVVDEVRLLAHADPLHKQC